MKSITWDKVLQLVGVIGTWMLAIIAIWGSVFRRRFIPAKLVLEEHNYSGDFTKSKEGVKYIYYHIKVKNKSKWTDASKVRVLLAGISRCGADKNSFIFEQLAIPLQFTWSFSNFNEMLPTVGPERYVDLGFLRESNSEKRFSPSLYAFPGNFKGYIGPNESLRYKVIATADNLQSSDPLFLEISWNGKFTSDKEEMVKNLIIKKVSSL